MSFDSPLPPYNASDPSATFVNSSCLELLMIELVPMAYRIVNEVDAGLDDRIAISSPEKKDGGSVSGKGSAVGTAGNGTGGVNGRKMDEDEERDAVFFRLEMLGYRVGQGLVERFSRDRPRFTDTLDVIKFLCKDLWMLLFRKQIDNLKTNHRGVYVLTDNSFRPFARMSTEPGGNAVVRAQPFLWYPCGIIRGALASMGINATVQAETSELPGATFQIKSITAKP
ncbi:related to TRS33-TRAPP subunit of 33 kDa involved in targeting and fusion of ER to golgi transp [Phialocephala subalpina]|uniref:Related to TRS33-TRAPP subunit of 33 kDa involved in targeting and fusion of ER to golgi transp n=1 Tax=Phialocephala subalpina TaxID=576137 RepID=A0A1L7X1T5_9HELO|nr:related to TRS33-TRAPP subunit of 33 kDa involved in targeting and fusion of ER to golgi transp [Phialocephala subalpina]